MSWALTMIGLLLAVMALVAKWYLGVRNRQLRSGASRIEEFRKLSLELLAGDLPEEGRRQIGKMAAMAGTGRVTRHLVRALADGKMSSDVPRANIEEWRRHWVNVPQETRIRFTQAIFTGMLADSYYAGLIGTFFRRTMFFVTSDLSEIAKSVDALETRMLIVGSTDFDTSRTYRFAGSKGLARA